MKFWFDAIAAHNYIPVGVSGNWSVRRRVVEGDRDEWKRLNGGSNPELSPPGVYTELYEGDTRRISDDLFVLNRDTSFVRRASGIVLLTGLGLGVTAIRVANKSNVRRVDVVEISSDVIALVAKYLPSSKINIVKDDAYTHIPVRKYDFVWHDCFAENPVNVRKLLKQYNAHTKWQGVCNAN